MNKIKKEVKIIRAIELIEKVRKEPKPNFLWRGIPEGSKGLFTGVGKTGKTTFAENLGIALAVGKKNFFGSSLLGVPKKVLFINLEESYRLRSRRNLKQIDSLTTEEREFFGQNFFSTPEDFPEFIVTENDWELLQAYIEASEADIVIIDSLSHLIDGKIEDSSAVIAFTKKFRKYVVSQNKTIIVIHHNTKGNDKPIEQDNIAGSRIVSQEFEYAYGFSHIPSCIGGSYMTELFNKYAEKDGTNADLYEINSNGWFEYIKTENKYKLYANNYNDRRKDDSNKDLIYEYVESQISQTGQPISTSELMRVFVDSQKMSKDTLHSNLKKLMETEKIISRGRGEYSLPTSMPNK